MVHRRSLIALGAFASTIMLAAGSLLGTGMNSHSAAAEVAIVASAPTTVTTGAPATTAVPPTTDAPITTTTAAPATLPPTAAAPRPPTTPAAPKPTVTVAPRPVAAPRPAPVVAAAPAQSGGGSPSDYTLIGYRWNPCSVVTVSSTGPDVSGVVAELASITGLHLQTVAGGGQITVAWGATPAGGEVGQTDWRSVGAWMTSATVTLNVLGTIYMPTLLRHELGHALGLGHAGRSNEIMYGTVGLGSPTTYQPGDLAGLHAIGASAGC